MDYKKILAKITEKWPVKALSVVAALFLFAFHRMSDLEERYFSVPLNLDIAVNLLPCNDYPRNVRITMRGANTIYHISETDIEARLDLTKYSEPGLYKETVHILRKGSAAETEILEIITDPAAVSLELDTKMSKQVALSPNFQGYVETGFELVSYTMEPRQAVIEGPMRLVEPITELSTDFIDLSGQNSDFSAQVRIINPNQLLTIRGDRTLLFRGFVKETIMINTLENLPIGIKGLADNLEAVLEPGTASIKINGAQNKLEGISTEMLSLSVDCSSIGSEGIYELPLLVESEIELNVERRDPEIIKATVRRKTDY